VDFSLLLEFIYTSNESYVNFMIVLVRANLY